MISLFIIAFAVMEVIGIVILYMFIRQGKCLSQQEFEFEDDLDRDSDAIIYNQF